MKRNFDKYLEAMQLSQSEDGAVVSVPADQVDDIVYGDRWRKSDLLSAISLNAKDEHEAIEGYTRMLSQIKGLPDSSLKTELEEKIKEIISDELEHAKVLTEFYERVSEIEAAED